MIRSETHRIINENSFFRYQTTLGLLFLATFAKLLIDIPKIRPINRVRITKNGVVINENGKTKKRIFEIPDDHTGIININGLNWLFRDKKSSTDNIKGEIRIGGKMAKHGDRIHMRKGAKVDILQEEPSVERDGVKVRFV